MTTPLDITIWNFIKDYWIYPAILIGALAYLLLTVICTLIVIESIKGYANDFKKWWKE